MQIVNIDRTCLLQAPEAQFFPLLEALGRMNAFVPIKNFSFALATSSPEPETYLYRIELVDGRLWRQRIDFASSPNDPEMTFNVSDEWKVSEFALNRPIREELVRLYTVVGLRAMEITVDNP